MDMNLSRWLKEQEKQLSDRKTFLVKDIDDLEKELIADKQELIQVNNILAGVIEIYARLQEEEDN